MSCTVCGENTQDPFIIYDTDKRICSYICSNRNPEGIIKFDRIVNIEDFNAPLPVIPTIFEVKSDKEIMAMTNIKRANYERELNLQMKKDPIGTVNQINLINMYSDPDSDYDTESSTEDYSD
uniref:Uncharacterized protein n=1 Tax=viral metagenome TaxID=1070528 RepID=A0A6C0CY09_9ZZZZ